MMSITDLSVTWFFYLWHATQASTAEAQSNRLCTTHTKHHVLDLNDCNDHSNVVISQHVQSEQSLLGMQIAVPTSVGYGAALQGITPLLSALVSSSPGVSVVNIDNGFGAAMVAARILMTASKLRRIALAAQK